ncbi:uncharacterized protein LOC131673451 [Phymastichus coffea]|uniref:uncharacterized protein LOC131673451 n=1 Tax=Phymastichus coffea TaxID=108790 RepID=UPI00273B5BA9|nr:uncharacterized protein LOC131673451 [Phymastichus coffea]
MYEALFFIICFITKDVLASNCYSKYCENTTNFVRKSHEQCLVDQVQRGVECQQIRFENLGHVPPIGEPLAQVMLSAYVRDFGVLEGKATAFNFSIDNVNFNRLTTRYQSLGDEETSVCRHVHFYRNQTNYRFKDFFVACPFYNNSYENNTYRLEYLISGDNYEYSRKLVFVVPDHKSIADSVKNVALYTPFVYVDVSDSSTLTLYIQPLPKRFNVSSYKVWMINYDTNVTKEVVLYHVHRNHYINYNFSVSDGVIYFKVAVLHFICHHDYGCINSTSPFISIKQTSNRLLIMIISFIWIPPVIFFAAYHIYKLYKRREIIQRAEKKPKCLLVYSPSHMAHVNVMVDLARYLRCCNIHAMIDTLDIPETPSKDPILWCNEAFQAADVILIAASPQTGETASVVYRNMDTQALRLLKENYPRRNKRYYVVHFPYCKEEDIPREAQLFEQFMMPEELDKLVKTVHEVEYIRFFAASEKDLVDSIKLAKIHVIPKRKSSRKIVEHEDLLLPDLEEKDPSIEVIQLHEIETKSSDASTNRKSSKSFRTNIEELNLLGESTESEAFAFSPPAGSKFRIDTLDL